MRWLAFLLLSVSLSTQAWTGTGNDRITAARDYMRFMAGGTSDSDYEFDQWVSMYWFQGVVVGLSTGLSEKYLPLAICYPELATTGQIVEVAAQYLIDHPEKRAQSLDELVFAAHMDAFGLQMDETCSKHQEWMEYHY